jgi:hypothetical protein
MSDKIIIAEDEFDNLDAKGTDELKIDNNPITGATISMEDGNKISNTSKINKQKGMVDFLQWDLSEFTKIKDFYGLHESLAYECFYVREDSSLPKGKGKATSAGSSKSVYYIPLVGRQLMLGDRDNRLKIVSAGVKMLCRKSLADGRYDYRLLQDGIEYLAPLISKRKLHVEVQDFCNILGGGLVSYSTLSSKALNGLSALTEPGVVIAVYSFSPNDLVIVPDREEAAIETQPQHEFYAVCWKGNSRSLNVMCGKIGGCRVLSHLFHLTNLLCFRYGQLETPACGSWGVPT